jgi:hypothetical protein
MFDMQPVAREMYENELIALRFHRNRHKNWCAQCMNEEDCAVWDSWMHIITDVRDRRDSLSS